MNCPVWAVLPLFQPSPREVVAMVRAAESLGMTGVLATDHLAGWRRPSGPVLEATAVLGMVGAVAKRRIGSLVLQTAVRSPCYTARVADTLATVSRGSPLIGLGVGDSRSRREAERLGMAFPPLRERLVRLEETIAAIRSQSPGVEIWVGGWRPELRELAARTADGWNAWGGDRARLEAAVAHVKEMNPACRVSWGGLLSTDRPPDELRRTLLDRVEAGAESLVVALTPPGAATLRRWGPPIFGEVFRPTRELY